MSVWAKLDGLKRQVEGAEFSMQFAEINHKLQEPKARKALSSLGLSKGGIAEISKGDPISQPRDQKIVSAVLAIVAEAIIDKKFG